MTYFHNEQDAIADWLTHNTPTICPPNTYAKPEWESDVSTTIGNRLRGGRINRVADAKERAKRERKQMDDTKREAMLLRLEETRAKRHKQQREKADAEYRQIMAQIKAGKTVADIAQQRGVTTVAINQRIKSGKRREEEGNTQ